MKSSQATATAQSLAKFTTTEEETSKWSTVQICEVAINQFLKVQSTKIHTEESNLQAAPFIEDYNVLPKTRQKRSLSVFPPRNLESTPR